MFRIKKYILVLAGVTLGAIGGFLYRNYVGCLSGTCPITSSVKNSTLYGAMMGGLLLSMFTNESKK